MERKQFLLTCLHYHLISKFLSKDKAGTLVNWNILENISDGNVSREPPSDNQAALRSPQGGSVFFKGIGRSTRVQWEATDPKVHGQYKLYLIGFLKIEYKVGWVGKGGIEKELGDESEYDQIRLYEILYEGKKA